MPKIRKVAIEGNPNAYKEYKAIVEKYKVQNPVKYELKKLAFEKKLALLKGDK